MRPARQRSADAEQAPEAAARRAVEAAGPSHAPHGAPAGAGRRSAASVLALQRSAGNRSTAALLQRDDDEKDTGDAPPVRSAGAARGFKALRGVVAESKAFNAPGRKQSGPLVLDEGVAEALGPEGVEGFKGLMAKRAAREAKTTTAGGAFLASQVGSKEKIGSAAAYTSIEQRDGHLGEFMKGAHAFVSNDAYLKIRGEHLTEANFNAWGAGSNFVAPLSDADALVAQAAAEGGRGLFLLEEELGIPPMMWVNQCRSADYGIWRFKIRKPEALNLRIPSGGEYGAYGSWVDRAGEAHRGEWRPGGTTLGGAREAVIDQIGAGRFGEKGEAAGLATRTKLAELQRDGVLDIVLDTSLAANTKRVLAERDKPPG